MIYDGDVKLAKFVFGESLEVRANFTTASQNTNEELVTTGCNTNNKENINSSKLKSNSIQKLVNTKNIALLNQPDKFVYGKVPENCMPSNVQQNTGEKGSSGPVQHEKVDAHSTDDDSDKEDTDDSLRSLLDLGLGDIFDSDMSALLNSMDIFDLPLFSLEEPVSEWWNQLVQYDFISAFLVSFFG